MPLSIALLGPFWATVDDESMTESRAKRIEALLAYLAIESAQPHRREHLVGLLFPEMPDDQARTNLRQTLTRLRRSIKDDEADPPYLLVTRESTQFNPNSAYFLDLADFDRLLAGCSLHTGRRQGSCPECMKMAAKGVALYRGPFLDGFFLEDSAAFDDWILGHRQRLQQAALDALQQLSAYHERLGAYDQAAHFAQRQITIEPWHEEAYRQLMRVLAYQGRRDAALRQYEVLRKLLAEELGVEPMPETESLRRQLATIGEQRPHRLPPRDLTFIGRSAELGLLSHHLVDPEQRLLTMVGSGGAGKTALAVEAGWRAIDRYLGPFMHGVYFVPLASVATETGAGKGLSNLLVTAVAEALDFSFSGTQDPQAQLLDYLGDKSLLLILDNFEHLVNTGREFVQTLLLHTTAPKIMVTSRSRLNLTDEWILQIDGLPYPQSDLQAGFLTSADDYEAISLFVRRAQRHVAGFALSSGDDAPEAGHPGGSFPCPERVAARICRLVQGFPLGIELAASWVRFLDCQEIAAELASNLDFLESAEYDLPERHRSMRAVFDTSWNLLSKNQQALLSQLSIFAGPFDRDAAAAITGASLSQLANLVDHSFLRRLSESSSATTRFEILEVIRQYAAEKLSQEPSESEPVDGQPTAPAEAVSTHHSHYYLDFLEGCLNDLRGSRQVKALTEIASNMPNIRVAWSRAAATGDVRALGKSLETLSLFYYIRSWFTEGEERFGFAAGSLALARDNEEADLVWARLVAQQGWFAFLLGRQTEGKTLLGASVATLRNYALRDRAASVSLALALDFLAVVTYTLGDYKTAQDLVQEGLFLSEAAGDIYSAAVAQNVLSQISYLQGHYEMARNHCEKALALNQTLESPWSLGFSLTNLGRVSYAVGNYGDAEKQFREALAIRQSLGDKRGQALCLIYLGDTAMAGSEFSRAEEAYQDGLTIFQEIGNQTGMATSWIRLGHVARQHGAVGKAGEHFRQGLILAQQAHVIPGVLDALAGIAWLMVKDSPKQASEIAQLIHEHPAASDRSHSMALELLQTLAVKPVEDEPGDMPGQLDKRLAEVVTGLLS